MNDNDVDNLVCDCCEKADRTRAKAGKKVKWSELEDELEDGEVFGFDGQVRVAGGEVSGEVQVRERDEEQEVVEQEEARDPLRRSFSRPPSEEEIRAHRATHLPFREWCPECVAGAANDFPHRRHPASEKLEVPEVHLDYCFLLALSAATTL